MKRATAGLATLIVTLAPTAVFAAHGGAAYHTAAVIDAVPVTRTVRVPVEQEVCWDETYYERTGPRRSPVPGIIGAIVGGVIGNQFGGGSGQDALTVAGAALGATVATNANRRNNPDRYHAVTEQRCDWETHYTTEEEIVGWDVTYEYNGEIFETRMREEPGDRIRVRVNVEPLSG
ncbi:MAG: glycine zipper 2TM domain-containing protein [Xanthomonadales bacterium]|nr:glycine zipper 2TM domain-containing protein [Xanthomonadales bacterium]